jgi:hypothetical protein
MPALPFRGSTTRRAIASTAPASMAPNPTSRAANTGCVSVGIDNDTAQFLVSSIRRWLHVMGRPRYREMRRLMITAGGGGSNGSRLPAVQG